MNDSSVLLAALGVVSACVGGLIWVIKYLFTKITPSLDNLTKATHANTKATQSADTYLRERNGRDNKMHKELIDAVGNISKQIVSTATITASVLKESPINQVIENQEVQSQVVVKKSDK